MGTTKKELFTQEQNQISSIAKALGHPARIAIISHVLKAENCINGDLVKELGLAQATISQHLKELKSAGLIKGTIEGTSVCYCIDPVRWNEIQHMFNDFFNQQASCEDDDCC